jgi:outer membrane receptor protein involved in Fe transport
VNVTVQGTVIGAITDVNGAYTIKVPGTSAVLLFSSIGYSTKQVTVGSQSVIDMILLSDTRALQEVVVVGYGTRKREELTGSISTVSSKDMKISTAPTAVGRMQGQVAGVTVVNSNTPGGDAFVRVRGMGTINDSRPLYVIDGVPSDPVEIAKREALKTSDTLGQSFSAFCK